MSAIDLAPAEFDGLTRLVQDPTGSAAKLDLSGLLTRKLVAVREDRVLVDPAMQAVINGLSQPTAVISVFARSSATLLSTVVNLVPGAPAVALTETADGARLALLDGKKVAEGLLAELLPQRLSAASRDLAELQIALTVSVSVVLRGSAEEYVAALDVLLLSDGSGAVVEPGSEGRPRSLAGRQELDEMVEALCAPLVAAVATGPAPLTP